MRRALIVVGLSLVALHSLTAWGVRGHTVANLAAAYWQHLLYRSGEVIASAGAIWKAVGCLCMPRPSYS